jgi:hypothetical protein
MLALEIVERKWKSNRYSVHRTFETHLDMLSPQLGRPVECAAKLAGYGSRNLGLGNHLSLHGGFYGFGPNSRSRDVHCVSRMGRRYSLQGSFRSVVLARVPKFMRS